MMIESAHTGINTTRKKIIGVVSSPCSLQRPTVGQGE